MIPNAYCNVQNQVNNNVYVYDAFSTAAQQKQYPNKPTNIQIKVGKIVLQSLI